MKPGASVSKSQLDAATLSTQNELKRAGFWNEGSKLPSADVYWCRFPQLTMPGALGFFVHESGRLLDWLLGYEAGHIYIPKWVLAHGPWQRRGSLRDVVRHEYGHAVAHYYPNLIQRSARFTDTFGGRYFGKHQESSDVEHCVSTYAATQPAEDFAETFMFFLRHGGRLPAQFTSSVIKRKWRFVRDLSETIGEGKAKW
jgi:hypothetical protein